MFDPYLLKITYKIFHFSFIKIFFIKMLSRQIMKKALSLFLNGGKIIKAHKREFRQIVGKGNNLTWLIAVHVLTVTK